MSKSESDRFVSGIPKASETPTPAAYRGLKYYLAENYMFKVHNRNTRTSCDICSTKTPEQRHWRLCLSGVFIFNFEHISYLVLLLLLLTLSW